LRELKERGLDRFLGRSVSLADRVEELTGFKLSSFQRQAVRLVEESERNLVAVAPTGAGKSLVGYAAMLRYGQGFYLAPYIAIMNEKYSDLSRLLRKVGYTVLVSNRDHRIPYSAVLKANVRIMSPYKFLAYAHMLSPEKHGKAVVADEFHKISGDPMFEAAITMAKARGFRVIALSATVADEDVEAIARWLDADVVKETKRPVRIEHQPIQLRYNERRKLAAAGGVSVLREGEEFSSLEEVAATVAARLHSMTGRPVIVWAPTRSRVERIAEACANMLPQSRETLHLSLKLQASNPSEGLLRRTVRHKVFIHHGGLSHSARKLVEEEYRRRGGVMVTAYTLSHGVNLPGTFLVMSTIWDYKGDPLDASTFHQIAGRAGRPGLDSVGVVLTLVVGESELAYYRTLVSTTASRIEPKMLSDHYSLCKLLLPVYATTRRWDDVGKVARMSYSYFVSQGADGMVEEALKAVREAAGYYERVGGREARHAMLMGMLPLEFEAVKSALSSSSYREAVGAVVRAACEVHGVSPAEVWGDIERYGFLASFLGSPHSRSVADTAQTILEMGMFWASRVYGWGSQERVKLAEVAKAFVYAGNPRVEPLASAVEVDVLRRMVKAVPQLVSGAEKDEAVPLVAVAVKEAYIYRRRVKREEVEGLSRLVYQALTGEPPEVRVLREAVSEAVSSLEDAGVKVV